LINEGDDSKQVHNKIHF